jgi:N-methylhydantoinase A
VGDVLTALHDEALAVVSAAAPGAPTVLGWRAAMRYVGQGHEIDVDLPVGMVPEPGELHTRFEKAYHALFARIIPHLPVEVLSWVLTLSTVVPEPPPLEEPDWTAPAASSVVTRAAFDASTAKWADHAVLERAGLNGRVVLGPALIVEPQTTTVVGAAFAAAVDGAGNLVLRRHSSPDRAEIDP